MNGLQSDRKEIGLKSFSKQPKLVTSTGNQTVESLAKIVIRHWTLKRGTTDTCHNITESASRRRKCSREN